MKATFLVLSELSSSFPEITVTDVDASGVTVILKLTLSPALSVWLSLRTAEGTENIYEIKVKYIKNVNFFIFKKSKLFFNFNINLKFLYII